MQCTQFESYSTDRDIFFSYYCDTVCDGNISESFRFLHISFYALSKVTAALNENVL